MKTLRRCIAAAAGVCAATALTVTPAHATSGYHGDWMGIDNDGSNVTMSIRGNGPRYAVRGYDDAATVCDGAPAHVNGPGQVSGDWLYVQVTIACAPGGNRFRHTLEIAFTHDANTDTLNDGFGVIWSRA